MTIENDYQRLYVLQDLDLRIKAIQERLQEIPQEISLLEDKVRQIEAKREELKKRLKEVKSKRRDRELYIEKLEEQMNHLKESAQQARSNREYSELLLRMEDVHNQIRKAEDVLLEYMEEEEKLQKKYKEEEQEFNAGIQKIRTQIQEKEKEQKQYEEELQGLQERRRREIDALSKETRKTYERIHKSRRGIALAEVSGDVCSMCHIRIRPAVLQQLIARADIVLCENCHRILIFRPEHETRVEGFAREVG